MPGPRHKKRANGWVLPVGVAYMRPGSAVAAAKLHGRHICRPYREAVIQ